MTPEQEILEDALIAAGQRAARFAAELIEHGATLPLDRTRNWQTPSPQLETEMAAFVKRYGMTQDLVTRRLFRSVLAVRGTRLRTNAFADVIKAMAALAIVDDLPLWEEITKLRNTFAHDYAMSFAELVPSINDAWTYAPLLIAMIERVKLYVVDHHLLVSGAQHD